MSETQLFIGSEYVNTACCSFSATRSLLESGGPRDEFTVCSNDKMTHHSASSAFIKTDPPPNSITAQFAVEVSTF